MNKQMSAAVLHAPGDLRVEKIDLDQELQSDEVMIKVSHTGICGSDLDRIMTTGTYSFPTIPGHEFSGTVIGAGSSTDFDIGTPVVAAPMQPCFTCENCQQGNFGQCENYQYMGSRNDGAFAEYIKVSAENILPLPSNIPLSHGALVEPAAVTLHGLNRLAIKAGASVTILGCGTIGLFAVRLVKLLGATKIIAVDLDEQKLAKAKALGATHLINSGKTDMKQEIFALTKNLGTQFTVETAGVPITQIQAVEITKYQGSVLLLGTAHKDITFPANVFERVIRGEITLTGSWNSYSAPFPGHEWQTIIDFMADGSLDMAAFITHTISLKELPETIRKMQARKFYFNKVLVALESE